MRISDWSSDVCSSDLNGGAISHWVREGHAKFNNVGASFNQGIQNNRHIIGCWIPPRDKNHQSGAAFGAAFRETGGEAIAHNSTPNALATVKMSLSPRPEDRKSTRLNSSHSCAPRMPYSA